MPEPSETGAPTEAEGDASWPVEGLRKPTLKVIVFVCRRSWRRVDPIWEE